jgi:hypothetical protein
MNSQWLPIKTMKIVTGLPILQLIWYLALSDQFLVVQNRDQQYVTYA